MNKAFIIARMIAALLIVITFSPLVLAGIAMNIVGAFLLAVWGTVCVGAQIVAGD